MNKNAKGFTLVELLAVIVILAIIGIIAIPVVIRSLDNAKKNSFKIYAQRVLNRAKEKRQADELYNFESGILAVPNCYSIDDLELMPDERYSGRVVYSEGEYHVYLSDNTFYAPGLTFDELTDLNNILESYQEGFVQTASKECS